MVPITPTPAAPPAPEPATARWSKNPWLWAVVLGVLLLTAMRTCSGRHLAELPREREVPPFSLVDQRGAAITAADLEGRPWVASFIFTTCSTVCPKVSAANAELQRRLVAEGLDARLVSFTVDPEFDTPEVLTRYAARYDADPARWTFVTGPANDLYALIANGFQLAMGERRTDPNGVVDISHSTRLVLVDADNQIRGYFGSTDEELALIVSYLAQLRDAAPAAPAARTPEGR